jgi:2-keto-myo-inositol isomerase
MILIVSSRLALHTWTLDTTPLAEVLRIARRTGWQAVELRRADFARAQETGQSAADVLELVRTSGLSVAAVGVEFGWMFAQGTERQRLLSAFAESCEWASALECTTVASPADFTQGDLSQAVASVREVGYLAEQHGVRLALELQTLAEQFNSLDHVREALALADHPRCGLLLDTYHIERTGGGTRAYEDLDPSEIAYVQYSDVPIEPKPDMVLDRLAPGHGVIPFEKIFQLLSEKGYDGYLTFEAPNPAAWVRDPDEVAREALAATRARLIA